MKTKIYQLTQKEIDILDKSEEDIKLGRIIFQKDLDIEDLKWLSSLNNF
jgi:hypothetical protein